jgi:4-amino-4-deoxy-L-arabinose transferase-like glycosyltransferase
MKARLNRREEHLVILLLCALLGLGSAGLALYLLISDLVGIITLAFGGILIFLVATKHHPVRKPLIAAFALRAAFALVHYYIVPLPDSQADALTFERLAAEWAEHGFVGMWHQFRTGAYLYPWLISVVYSLVGRSPLTAQAINVFFGSLIVRNVYLIAKQFWDDKVSTRAAWVAAVFPTLVLYSAITMREVAIVFPLTLSVFYFLRWLREERPTNMVKALAACGISVAFHTGVVVVILVMALGAVFRWLRALLAARTSLVLKRGFVLGFIAIGIGAILASGWGLEKIGGLKVGSVVDWLANQQLVAARGRAAYLQHLQPRSAFDLIWQVPIRITYFLFMPFPWFVRSWADLLGLTMSACNLLLTILVLRSFSKVWATYERRWGLYILFALLVTFALTTSNYGTSVRHSSKLIPLALALAGIPKVRL